jgi:hypothetical protein
MATRLILKSTYVQLEYHVIETSTYVLRSKSSAFESSTLMVYYVPGTVRDVLPSGNISFSTVMINTGTRYRYRYIMVSVEVS